MALWLATKFQHEKRGILVLSLRRTLAAAEAKGLSDSDTVPWCDVEGLSALVPDADHSALLYRVLRGHDPLSEPPPLRNSYPVYPDGAD